MLDFSLIYHPNEILKKPTSTVKDFFLINSLAEKMISIMKNNNGIGLAANQIGLNDSIFVMHVDSYSEKPTVFVNPKILVRSKKVEYSIECCLSIPGVSRKIPRNISIFVEAQNENGETFQKELKFLEAFCFQHEFDHLNGKLIIDY